MLVVVELRKKRREGYKDVGKRVSNNWRSQSSKLVPAELRNYPSMKAGSFCLFRHFFFFLDKCNYNHSVPASMIGRTLFLKYIGGG